MFSSRSFIVSGLMFRSLIHFEFIFVYGVKRYIPLKGSNKGVVTGYETHCPQHHLDNNFEGILPSGCFFKNINCGNNTKTIFHKASFTHCQNKFLNNQMIAFYMGGRGRVRAGPGQHAALHLIHTGLCPKPLWAEGPRTSRVSSHSQHVVNV